MKHLFYLALLLLSIDLFAQDDRPTHYDLINTNLSFSEINFTEKTITCEANLKFRSLENNLSQISIDLLDMKLDFVHHNGNPLSYTYNDSLIVITLAQPIQKNTELIIDIAYHGTPVKDPTGWGGFYFTGDYAFNLGVGFGSNPHTYGRAWYPTIDHFEERSTYQFSVTTDSNQMALCNGLLTKSDTSTGKITWHYSMDIEIPSYLVSMAVAPYVVVKDVYNGVQNSVPIWLACKAIDTTKVKGSFVNLKSCAQIFESQYGPHPFHKIGFTMVPFGSGAMEHATNIAYPISACDGTTNRETLMAHEFAHHWWGDNITCETALDMWINEGFASYSEALFTEKQYGMNAYKNYVRDNHKYVLHFSHIRDDGPRAVYGIPHEFTYGSHVYDKGADVAHTLRWYMGDDAFKKAVHSIMKNNSMQNISTLQLRDSLQKYTNKDMTAFFQNWVLTPGFPHLEIIHQESKKTNDGYAIELAIEQRTKYTWEQYKSIPIEIAFHGPNGEIVYKEFEVKEYINPANFTLGFDPVMVVLDPNEQVSDAITEETIMVKGAQEIDLKNALMKITVLESSDSSLIRVEHHWVEAKRTENTPSLPFVSKERYWTVDGIFASNLNMTARIYYDGRTPSSGTYGYLDNKLIISSEENLVLLYRESQNSEWELYPDYTKNMAVKTDRFGYIDIKNVKKGQYAFGFNDPVLNLEKKEELTKKLSIYPNPNKNKEVTISFPMLDSSGTISIFDIQGKLVYSRKLKFSQNQHLLQANLLPKGNYIVVVQSRNEKWSDKMIVH